MIPNSKERDVQTSGLDETASFGISDKDSAHIMTILRDTLYSDKILAVLREYSANAWDAHRMVGKDTLPIRVTLPTELEPTLSIRDFGPGLSQQEVFQVYTQYGASTKRTSDKAVGMLGIGSKSGFAYSDSFTINSFNGGTKSTYVAVLDKSEKGVITLLDRQPCGEETGIEIQIPVKPSDIGQFIDKAKGLFRYFDPKPEINTEIADGGAIKQKMKSGILTEGRSGNWTAVMGCIPYRINIQQLTTFRNIQDESLGIQGFLSRLTGVLFFNIGEVQISASREELKYSDETKTALVNKFNDLVEEYVRGALEDIEKSGLTQFQRRTRLSSLGILKFTVPDILKAYLEPRINVKEIGDFSFFWAGYRDTLKDPIDAFEVHQDTTIVLKDDGRAFKGFRLPHHSIVVKSKKGDWDKQLPQLEIELEKLLLKGIPIIRLSSCEYTGSLSRRASYEFNEKHKMSTFRFHVNPGNGTGSDVWTIESHEPAADDVYVILEKFKTVGYNFYQEYKTIRSVAELVGQILPTIYGYKSTEKKPVTAKDLKGLEFRDWAEKWQKELADAALTTPSILDPIKLSAWYEVKSDVYREDGYRTSASENKLATLITELGAKHRLIETITSYTNAENFCRKYEKTLAAKRLIAMRPELQKIWDRQVKIARKRIKVLEAAYPLLGASGGNLARLFGASAKDWIQYVKLIDKEREDNARQTKVHSQQRVPDNCVGGKDSHGPELAAQLQQPANGNHPGGLGQHPQVPDGLQSPP